MPKHKSNKEITNLKLDPRNIRRHSERNRAAIAKSLETVGAGRGVLADADGIIRAGNGVFEEWIKRGGKIKVVETTGDTLVVTKRRDLRGKKAIQAALLDNLTADTSAFDYEVELLRNALDDDPVSRGIIEQYGELQALLSEQPPPSLSELARRYSEPSQDEFYPVIRIRVSPEVKQRFDSLMAKIDGVDDGDKFGLLLLAVNLESLTSRSQ